MIIPSLSGEVAPLLHDLHRQSCVPAEIEVVRGVRPNGRARNIGVARTSAPLLVFIDDDARLGDTDLLAHLVSPLLADPSIGVTGASKLLPPDAPLFQRWVAREVPRTEHPVVAVPFESNPDPPSFYCEITTTCCAMRREVFEQAGGFDETLLRGVDTEFFVRVRRLIAEPRSQEPGARSASASSSATTHPERLTTSALSYHSPRASQPYRFVLVPNTWVYHPAPGSLRALLRKHFWYGAGHAQEVRRDPTRARGRNLRTPLHTAAFLLFRSAIVIPNIFLPYSFAAPSWRPGFKPLKALASYAGALGYAWGWYRAP